MPNRSPEDRVSDRLENWKEQLIDLSLRNKMLNFRTTRGTIEIVDEHPQLMLSLLCANESLTFKSKDELETAAEERSPDPGGNGVREAVNVEASPSDAPQAAQGSSPEQTPESDDGSSQAERTQAFSRGLETGQQWERVQNPENLRDCYLEAELQTPYTDDELTKRLTKLYRKADRRLKEQGINSLALGLGMLEWFEGSSSDKKRKAPLVLMPVQLTRENVRSNYRLEPSEEEPIFNPALRLKLSNDFDIDPDALPSLTEICSEESPKSRVEELFAKLESVLTDFPRWRVTRDIALRLFSFHKYLIFRDLDNNAEHYKSDKLIQALSGRDDVYPAMGELPEDIQNADLDERLPPWGSAQVLDADSSQLRTILAVREGHDLVIEGPPGTGKSQTITNMIAQALADGKKVLFVSEKMAALDVVQDRLESVGLGNFCLELHSNKTSKKEFVEELARSIDEEIPNHSADTETLTKLEKRQEQLGDYVLALHREHQTLGVTPFEAIGKLTEVEDARRVNSKFPDPLSVSSDHLEEMFERVSALASALEAVGDPEEHPLRGIGLEHATRTTGPRVEEALGQALDGLRELIELAGEQAEQAGLAEPETFGDIQLNLEGAGALLNSPGSELSLLQSERWNQMSSDAEDLLEAGQRYQELHDELTRYFKLEKLERNELKARIEQLEEYSEKGWWKLLSPFFWKLNLSLNGIYQSDSPPGIEGKLGDLKRALERAELHEEIVKREDLGKELFGSRWEGPKSDFDELKGYADWLVEVRSYALDKVLTDRGLKLAAEGSSGSGEIAELTDRLEEKLKSFRDTFGETSEELKLEDECTLTTQPSASLQSLVRRLEDFARSSEELRAWTEYVAARNECNQDQTSVFLDQVEIGERSPDQLLRMFKKWFWTYWIEAVFDERPVLKEFNAKLHEARLDEFRELDEKAKTIARNRVRAELDQSRQDALIGEDSLRGEITVVQREAGKASKIAPIRRILQAAPNAVQTIKPCFMMSPLSLAKYVDPEKMKFDLVVFDEASQITPADAVGALIRGDQSVIVGDSKQLPPTNFFSVQVEDDEELDPDADFQITDMESILEEARTVGMPSKRLKWHYRSQHESLIRFSNEEFYDDDPLLTYPCKFDDDEFLGVKFEYLPDAIYDGRGENEDEAIRIVEAIVEHARERDHLSLGVGTFGMSQQSLILDILDEKRREHPEIEPFFHHEGEDEFFVKNLENIQGDDRDVIFISVTYGPDENGNIRRQFGPVNRDNGWRRLNVLTTRAKKQVRVFSSMRAEQIRTDGNISQGVKLLKRYLEYAETGSYPSSGVTNRPPESPFEQAVINKLKERGWDVEPQVGESGYRIDIGVRDPDRPGKFLCGIECDGRSYHSTATARERDRLRQQVLEARGWEILRIWSTDWFHDPGSQLDKIETRMEEIRQQPEDYHPGEEGSLSDELHDTDEEADNKPDSKDESANPSGENSKPAVEEIEVPDYQLTEISRMGDRDDFYECSRSKLKRAVLKVLQTEAPIHLEELTRRVMSFWGLSRTGSRIRKRVREGVKLACQEGKAEVRDDFVWLADMDEVSVRNRDIEGRNFDSEHICYEEAAQAVRVLLEHRAPLLQEDIPSEAVRLLGFQRTGRRLSGLIEEAVDHLIEQDELRAGGWGIELAD